MGPKVQLRVFKFSYVNVCAMICLILSVSGVKPSSAKKDRKLKMEPSRRAGDVENPLYSNPCDYKEEDMSKPVVNNPQCGPNLEFDVKSQAESAISVLEYFKDDFAKKAHNFDTFEELLQHWETTKWVQDKEIVPWYEENVLPAEKKYNVKVSEKYLDDLVTGNIEPVLPLMYKTTKLFVAALFTLSKSLKFDTSTNDESLMKEFSNAAHHVRAVLCEFSDVMRARILNRIPLYDKEIPPLPEDQVARNAVLILRDTLNFLQYIAQVFEKVSSQFIEHN